MKLRNIKTFHNSQGTVVLGKNARFLCILSDGSRDRIPVSPLSFIRFQLREKKRKSTRGATTKRVKGRSGEKKKRNRQAFQDESSRAMRPRGLMCKSGLVAGYTDEEDGSLREKRD